MHSLSISASNGNTSVMCDALYIPMAASASLDAPLPSPLGKVSAKPTDGVPARPAGRALPGIRRGCHGSLDQRERGATSERRSVRFPVCAGRNFTALTVPYSYLSASCCASTRMCSRASCCISSVSLSSITVSPISCTNWLTLSPSASCICASEPAGLTR